MNNNDLPYAAEAALPPATGSALPRSALLAPDMTHTLSQAEYFKTRLWSVKFSYILQTFTSKPMSRLNAEALMDRVEEDFDVTAWLQDEGPNK